MTTVRLTAEQVPHVRQVLLYGLPEGCDDAETREEIASHIAQTSEALERLDRLGWEDDNGPREYTDDADRLAYIAARLIEWGADQPHKSAAPFEEASRRRKQLAPALTGVAILDQLDVPDSPEEEDA